MKKTNYLVIILLLPFFLEAQSTAFQWAKSIGGLGNDIAKKIVTDASNNVYTVGTFSGTVDFNTSPAPIDTFIRTSKGQEDIYLLKTDAQGNFIWCKLIGGLSSDDVKDIVVNSTNIYLCGSFQNTVDFDPSPTSTYTLSGGLSLNGYVLKLDINANLVWVQQFGGGGDDICNAIAVDGSDNVYGTGNSNSMNCTFGTINISNTNSGMCTFRINSNGTYNWAVRVAGAIGVSIAKSGSGVYIGGQFNGNVDFDPGSGSQLVGASGPGTDVYILNLSFSAGAFNWVKTIGGSSGFVQINQMKLDAPGNIYLTGSYNWPDNDFDPGVGVQNLPVNINNVGNYLLKLSSNGTFTWVKSFLAETNYMINTALGVEGNGKVYITGHYAGIVDMNPSTLAQDTFKINSGNVNKYNLFITKIDASGNFTWTKNINSVNPITAYGAIPTSIHIDANTAIYVTGKFGEAYNFHTENGSAIINPIGIADGFHLKLNQCVAPSPPANTTPLSNRIICSGNTTTLTASGSGMISWYSAPTGGNYLGSGATFITPVLNATTSFYAQDSTCTASMNRTSVPVTIKPSSSNLITQTACGSFTHNSQIYSSSGIYTQTLLNSTGCDSIITINLTIVPTIQTNLNQTACEHYNFNGVTYTTSGVYSKIEQSLITGCDSIVTINLTIKNINTTISNNSGILQSNQAGAQYQWLTCNNTIPSSYSAITGEVNQSFSTTFPGNFAVVINDGTCVDTSSCYSLNTVDLKEFKEINPLLVYPNPFNDELMIFSGQQLQKILITDVLGKVVFVESKLNTVDYYYINTSEFKKGIYFISTYYSTYQNSYKLIKL
jgi:hypothetical protein